MRLTGKDLTIKVNGIEISYDDLGNGLMPVIFIHAFPLNKASWNRQTEFLQESHRVISYDIRGFGNSGIDEEEITISVMVNDLIRMMEMLGIEKAIICGISMGGYIALNAVTRFPDKFPALILSDTQCISDSEEARQKRFDNIELVKSGKVSEFSSAFVGKAFSKSTHSNNRELVDDTLADIQKTNTQTIINTLLALANRTETCTHLKSIFKPTLILCGEEDLVTPPEKSAFMNEKISGSILHLIPGAGHFPNLEQPEVFNNHLKDFLDKFISEN